MIDEKLFVNFHSLITERQRDDRGMRLKEAHSFPRDIKLSSSEHTRSRMTTEMMHPTLLLELSHQRILQEIKISSERLSSLRAGDEDSRSKGNQFDPPSKPAIAPKPPVPPLSKSSPAPPSRASLHPTHSASANPNRCTARGCSP